MRSILKSLSGSVLLSLAALAQTGTVDQQNQALSASFNASASSLIWQQEIQAGLGGTLEGVELLLSGSVGSSFDFRVRVGGGWNTGAVLFQTQVVHLAAGNITVFVDTTSANIQLVPGSLFVFEIQGNNNGSNVRGSYVAGNPTYPNFLYLNGPGCFADCGWRLAFRTFMLTGPAAPQPYCTAGTTTSGCSAQISASANPSVSGATSCQIDINGVEGQKTGIVFYGLDSLPQPWCVSGGSSFLCVKSPTARSTAQSSGGSVGQCDGAFSLDWDAFQAANPGALGSPFSAGDKVYVQGWFRDPPACKSTSLSNAIEMTYIP